MTRGFTIVELLIVVVVIAILAAITIVAYNGIQNRAKDSAAAAATTQAAKKLALYMAANNDSYPATVDDAGITATSGTTYNYVVNNVLSPKKYCISSTSGNVSKAQIDTSSTAVSGTCVTNYVVNPSIETNGSGTGTSYGQGGAGTYARIASAGQDGGAFARTTWTTAPTTGGLWSYANSVTGLNAATKTYTASGYVRNSWAGSAFALNLVGYTSGGVVTGETYGGNVTIAANSWTRVTATWTNVPANTDYFVVRIRLTSGPWPPTGSTMDADAFMLTDGPDTYNYYDGSKANWVWNGTANNSSSFGPAEK